MPQHSVRRRGSVSPQIPQTRASAGGSRSNDGNFLNSRDSSNAQPQRPRPARCAHSRLCRFQSAFWCAAEQYMTISHLAHRLSAPSSPQPRHSQRRGMKSMRSLRCHFFSCFPRANRSNSGLVSARGAAGASTSCTFTISLSLRVRAVTARMSRLKRGPGASPRRSSRFGGSKGRSSRAVRAVCSIAIAAASSAWPRSST
mmetsp:Transcript_17770/g.54666  ORF Transcript_17770/g.54666 Transcript_17770/m.54666 type:complete len:200 (-) Transcript_17770:483-1082(-)